MSSIRVIPLGAGQDVGRSCILVTLGGKNVMFDCGMHMGFNDDGDYNMTPDRHLGAAWVSCCKPDILITESTYATTIRDSKRTREREFLEKVHHVVENGGKSYWERMNIKVPIYFSAGMAEKATEYYKLFITWTNQKIKETFVERNMFDFKHIKPLAPGFIDNPGPMVVFATSGMLHAGQSLHIFKKWAPDERNAVIIPGYCVAGTIGYKILNGVKRLEFDGQTLEVRCRVEYLSFSAHADARGIMQLIAQCKPRHVLLVHGEAGKMDFLKSRIETECGLPCGMPANGEMAIIQPKQEFVADAPAQLVEKHATNLPKDTDDVIDLGLIMEEEKNPVVMTKKDAMNQLLMRPFNLLYTSTYQFSTKEDATKILAKLSGYLQNEILNGTDLVEEFVDELRIEVKGTAVAAKIQCISNNEYMLYLTYSYQEEPNALKLLDTLKSRIEKDISC